MKQKSSYIKSILFVMLISLAIISGCGKKINGSYILSLKEVKEHKVNSIQVEFYNPNNRIESSSVTLSSEQETEQIHIQSFLDILKDCDEVADEEEKFFSPPSQSSHHILMTFDNDFVLEFYYSSDNNWLIWSNTSEQEGKKILQYYFLSPPSSSMQEWLSAIEPND